MPGFMEVVNELRGVIQTLQEGARVVSCPVRPITIPGIGTGAIYAADESLGTVFQIKVPKQGVFQSATFFDMDDEGSQVDFAIFKSPITATTDNSAFAPTDADLLEMIALLQFATSNDLGTGRVAELVNIGKAYSTPDGIIYVQAITRSTPTIAAANLPLFQIQILSGDPNFKEK